MEHNHISHIWLMVLLFGGALLLILLLPLIGLSQNWVAGIAIVVMIIVHLLMMRGHFSHNHKEHKGDIK